eukprot:m.359949 g.359949  ORF g.359949 m.359949 type:complete len:1714 (-) comp18827_c0_seq1:378-5519(-)
MSRSGSYRVNQRPHKSGIRCIITHLDNKDYSLVVHKKASGFDLWNAFLEMIDTLDEADYFSLYLPMTEPTKWLVLDESLSKQFDASRTISLEFGVKYFASSFRKLLSGHARLLMYLQLKEDLLTSQFIVDSQVVAVRLAALVVQAEMGDFEQYRNRPTYLDSQELLPEQTADILSAICSYHQNLERMTQAEAIDAFLKLSSSQRFYALDFHTGTLQNGPIIQLGIGPKGLRFVAEDLSTIDFYVWKSVEEITFRKKKVTFVCQNTAMATDSTSINPTVTKVIVCKTSATAKALWEACVQRHTFYRKRRQPTLKPKRNFKQILGVSHVEPEYHAHLSTHGHTEAELTAAAQPQDTSFEGGITRASSMARGSSKRIGHGSRKATAHGTPSSSLPDSSVHADPYAFSDPYSMHASQTLGNSREKYRFDDPSQFQPATSVDGPDIEVLDVDVPAQAVQAASAASPAATPVQAPKRPPIVVDTKDAVVVQPYYFTEDQEPHRAQLINPSELPPLAGADRNASVLTDAELLRSQVMNTIDHSPERFAEQAEPQNISEIKQLDSRSSAPVMISSTIDLDSSFGATPISDSSPERPRYTEVTPPITAASAFASSQDHFYKAQFNYVAGRFNVKAGKIYRYISDADLDDGMIVESIETRERGTVPRHCKIDRQPSVDLDTSPTPSTPQMNTTRGTIRKIKMQSVAASVDKSRMVADADGVPLFVEMQEIKPRENTRRPVCVFGTRCDYVLDELYLKHPEEFTPCIPHTSRPKRPSEVDGVDYHFVTSEEMQRDIEAGKYLEVIQYETWLYGLKVDSVQETMRKYPDKFCIADLGDPLSVRNFLAQGMNPIVVFLDPQSQEAIQKSINVDESSAEALFVLSQLIRDEFSFEITHMIPDVDGFETTADSLYTVLQESISAPFWAPVTAPKPVPITLTPVKTKPGAPTPASPGRLLVGKSTPEPLTAADLYATETISFEKLNGKLGFSFSGGTEASPDGIFVHAVIPGGSAALDGRLQPNDKLLTVNGVSVRSLPHKEASHILQATPPVVELVVQRQCKQVSLKPLSGKYGLGLRGGADTDTPIIISRLQPGSAAAMSGDLHIGNEITHINGLDVRHWSHESVMDLIKGSQDGIDLVIHPRNSFTHKVSRPGSPRSSMRTRSRSHGEKSKPAESGNQSPLRRMPRVSDEFNFYRLSLQEEYQRAGIQKRVPTVVVRDYIKTLRHAGAPNPEIFARLKTLKPADSKAGSETRRRKDLLSTSFDAGESVVDGDEPEAVEHVTSSAVSVDAGMVVEAKKSEPINDASTQPQPEQPVVMAKKPPPVAPKPVSRGASKPEIKPKPQTKPKPAVKVKPAHIKVAATTPPTSTPGESTPATTNGSGSAPVPFSPVIVSSKEVNGEGNPPKGAADSSAAATQVAEASASGVESSNGEVAVRDQFVLTPSDDEEDEKQPQVISCSFQSIPQRRTEAVTECCSVGSNVLNAARNRYRDILPYDDTRVKLEGMQNDYINASHVTYRVGSSEFKYLMTQGPKPTTCEHFWAMVWQNDVRLLCMLTRLVELSRKKSHQYWPEAGETMSFGPYKISVQREISRDGYTLRDMYLVNDIASSKRRRLFQFHYTDWPDHGVPANPDTLMSFIDEINAYKMKLKTPMPLLVHCSAGIGRSGVFVALELGGATLHQGKDVDLKQLLTDIRMQRMNLVQTQDQFLLTSKLLEAVAAGNYELTICP